MRPAGPARSCCNDAALDPIVPPATVRRRDRGCGDRNRTGTHCRVRISDPALLSEVEAASLLQSRALHPRELLDACLSRSAAHDGGIGSWIRIYPEQAYEAAESAAQRLAAGPAPLVCGLPIALKDLYAVAGLPVRRRAASSRATSPQAIPECGGSCATRARC
ncbi:amidase family protein [Rhodococcus sp. NPDC056960]|uniref:amidase family protein n=1 Tax=Rhodococcus sp. NPDC056960 TaxID=3345982 RepID=UPI00362D2DD9